MCPFVVTELVDAKQLHYGFGITNLASVADDGQEDFAPQQAVEVAPSMPLNSESVQTQQHDAKKRILLGARA